MNKVATMKVAVIGSLVIVASCLIWSCSAFAEPGDQGKASASIASIFEKGQTYDVDFAVFGYKAVLTVLEIGPGPWLKVKPQNADAVWINSNQMLSFKRIEPGSPTTSPSTSK